jgi:hypothetical protein
MTNESIPQPSPVVASEEPVAWQWRRKGEPWSLERTFNSQVHATTPDSEVRPLFARPSRVILCKHDNVAPCEFCKRESLIESGQSAKGEEA